MDVRCEACQTEYEFDDALVTGKGTSVKCTNCGHQFRIQAVGGDDKWIIETTNGKSLTFTSMRELQRGIASRLVSREDTLLRGDTRRMLGAIVELIPFFDEQPQPKKTLVGPHNPGRVVTSAAPPPLPPNASRPPPPGQIPKAPPNLLTDPRVDPPPQAQSNHPSGQPHANGSSAPPARSRMPSIPPPLPMRSRTATLRPAEGVAPPPMPTVKRLKDESHQPELRAPPPGGSHVPESHAESTQRYADRQSRPPPVASVPPPRLPPPDIEVPSELDVSSPLPPPTRVKRKPIREVESEDEDDATSAKTSGRVAGVPPKRNTGYILALLLVAGLGGFAFYWNREHPFFAAAAPAASSSAGTLDPRAQEYLTAGERALAEGNLELAREKLDKASALAEKDSRVLLSEARLQNALAEVPWLKLRILPPEAKDDQNLAKRDLEDATQRAKKAADDASAADATSVAALRARVDALRLAGDKAKAIPLAGELAGKPKDAENAYVLAMVDLVEPGNVPTPSTITRLREATEVDSSGRSRAALVYALALSGDPAAANAELEKLAARERPYPLTATLRSYVARAPNKVGGDAGAIAMNGRPAGDAMPGSVTATNPGGGAGGGGGGGGGGADTPLPAGDSRALVAEGDRARGRGDMGRARKAYEAALEKNPYDSEALTGLGECAHADHDLSGAMAEFKRAIQVNPRYLPALVGLGDVQWESGDQGSGQRTYKEIVDSYPDVAYPPRVKERAAAAAPPPPQPTQAPAPTPTKAPDPPQPPQPPQPPTPSN